MINQKIAFDETIQDIGKLGETLLVLDALKW